MRVGPRKAVEERLAVRDRPRARARPRPPRPRPSPGTSLGKPGLAGLVAGAMLTLAATGCALGASPAEDAAEPRRAPEEPIPLRVDNEGFHEVTVYAMSGGTVHRLGNVISLGHQTFHIPHTIVGGDRDLRVLAVRVGTRRAYMSGFYLVEEGHELELTVVTPLEASFLDVYVPEEEKDGDGEDAGDGDDGDGGADGEGDDGDDGDGGGP